MPVRPKGKPCPGCAKPIRLDAANCWFCGEVFNTAPCVSCSSPVQKGSVNCWFCGATVADAGRAADSPAPLPSPGASEAIQTSPRPLFQREEPPVLEVAGIKNCPRCEAEIPLSAAKCKHCGCEMTVGGASNRWGQKRRRIRPHHGGVTLALAILSFFCCGVILGPLAWAEANRDLNAMREGRMDPSGEGLTRAAQIVAVISTVLNLAFFALNLLAVLVSH